LSNQQRAIVVGVHLHHQPDFEYTMDELRELAKACDVEVVEEVTQRRKQIHPSHYIGKGKLVEVQAKIDQADANLVIFNDELSPSQIRNLERELDIKVIDRTMLILDIFSERARTREAQLQVEIAGLKYLLPRLVGLRASLSQQSGGVGTKNRGTGEKQLELDRRKIEARVNLLQKQLDKLVLRRQTQRHLRKKRNIPVVALVGYTNAGKSTLMNAMIEQYHPQTDKQVLEKDQLFATLETAVRRIRLPDNKTFLLTDTVGFVSKLPHHLIKAFRSTLEELSEADLLIHVVDVSHPEHPKQMETTLKTLQSIGVENIPTITAYNKADRTPIHHPNIHDDTLYLSAKQRWGIDELTQLIRKHLFKHYQMCQLFIPYTHDRIVAYLHESAKILKIHYEETGTRIQLELNDADYQRLKEFMI
jgi:GTP-binding protein HflX